jgi:Ssp1 endopeptidase immunity protein Rap1a
MRRIAIAALLLPISNPIAAQVPPPDPTTGNGLLALCTTAAGTFTIGLCKGYINGISDTALGFGFICYPQGVNNGQIDDVVVVALQNHPEERHKWSALLVTQYLKAAFPCAAKH